jgi:hypothetical protein
LVEGENRRSNWSISAPTENTDSVVNEHKKRIAKSLKDREDSANGVQETSTNSAKLFKDCKSIGDVESLTEELKKEEQSKHAKFREEVLDD